MKKILKERNGITLVALVITIIILLILAGITIAQLTENGLFERARQSEKKNAEAMALEEMRLLIYEQTMQNNGKITLKQIVQKLADDTENTYIVTTKNKIAKLVSQDGVGITDVNEVTDETEAIYVTNIKYGKEVKVSDSLEVSLTGDNKKEETSKLKIEVTNPIVSTNISATESDEPGKLKRGTASYINFTTTLDEKGIEYTVSPELPYKVLGNAKYTFTITAQYEGKTITEDVSVNVNQYVAPTGYVQYDAGDWTQEEIAQLQDKKLYDINISNTTNKIYKLEDETGLVFTFGGFTYKRDTVNSESIDTGVIITSRNQSVSLNDGQIKYDGWQIHTKTTKTDESGNIIKNEDGTDRIYVTKLVHAGTPEYFVYYGQMNYPAKAVYLLSNGKSSTTSNTLNSGVTINPRSWDMYKDKELDEKGYIKEIRLVTISDVKINANDDMTHIGKTYFGANGNR